MAKRTALYCALDRTDLDGALDLTRRLAAAVDGIKLGLEFVTANGPQGVAALGRVGLPLFLDLKFHDIPNTVAGAVRAAAAMRARMLTIHAGGGEAMIRAAVDSARDATPRPAVLAVTVLTSMDDNDLQATGVNDDASAQVERLAVLALDAGVDGLVCSPHEIAKLRERFGPQPRLVVPGIRPIGAALGDQKRTLSPAEAVRLGADVLVVGRPITEAAHPAEAAESIRAEIAGART